MQHDYQTEFDLTTLPQPVQEKVNEIFANLGFEPTAIRHFPDGPNGPDLDVYYGSLMHMRYVASTESLTLRMYYGLLGLPDQFTTGFYQYLLTVLQGYTKLPPSFTLGSKYDSSCMIRAVGLSLGHKWGEARGELERWFSFYESHKEHAEEARVMLGSGLAWVEGHEAMCQAAGHTEPFAMSIHIDDLSNYTFDEGGDIFTWSYSININPMTKAVALCVVLDGEGSTPDDAPKTLDEAVTTLENRAAWLEGQLAATRYMLEKVRGPGTKYSHSFNTDNEDEEDEDEDDLDDDE